MNIEAAAPPNKTVGTLEMSLALKDLAVTLAGLERVKVAAQEAAAAVASIGTSPGEGQILCRLLAEIKALRQDITSLRVHNASESAAVIQKASASQPRQVPVVGSSQLFELNGRQQTRTP